MRELVIGVAGRPAKHSQEAASLATRGSTGRPLFLLAATAVLAASLRTARLLAGAFLPVFDVVRLCEDVVGFSAIVITLQGHVFGDGLYESGVALGDQLRADEHE
ncbi:hypothetical protein MAHJHV59_46820 [Mycobacterium avium subsp. hominissuis]